MAVNPLTRSAWPRRRLSTWGLVVLALAGAGFVVVGLTPENVNLHLHLLGASNLVLSNLGLLLLGLACWREHRWRATVSLALAGLGFSGLLLGPLLIVLTGHGGGIGERLALYPIVVWLVCSGVALARQPHPAASAVTAQPAPATPAPTRHTQPARMTGRGTAPSSTASHTAATRPHPASPTQHAATEQELACTCNDTQYSGDACR